MKKWYCIGICLVLSACLLLLSACGKRPNPPANEPAQSSKIESTGSTNNTEKNNTQINEINGSMQENNTQANKTDDPTQGNNAQTNKKDDSTQGNNGQSTSINLNFKDVYARLQEEEIVSLFKGTQLKYETSQAYTDGFLESHGVSYKQEYFNDRSLILVELTPISGKIWKVTEVGYENGVVVCHISEFCNSAVPLGNVVDPSDPPVPELWACFVEVDFMIPDGTEIKVVFDEIALDYEQYELKYSEFWSKVKSS